MENLEEKLEEIKNESKEEINETNEEVLNVKDKLLEKINIEEEVVNEEIKKEKKKKKSFKTFLIGLVLIIFLLGGGVLLFKNLPTIMKGKIENNEINIVVNYKKNIFFNKYNINISFNGASMGNLAQGDSLSNPFGMPNGDYVITFSDENDVNNTTSKIVSVDGSNEYIFNVKAGWKGLEVSEKIGPYIKETLLADENNNENIAKDDIAEGENTEEKENK